LNQPVFLADGELVRFTVHDHVEVPIGEIHCPRTMPGSSPDHHRATVKPAEATKDTDEWASRWAATR